MPARAERQAVAPPDDWLLGWADHGEPPARDRWSESIRLFVPGGVVLAGATALSLLLITMPLHDSRSVDRVRGEADAAPVVQPLR